MLDIEKIRAQFPMLQKQDNNSALIYLDSAATTQKPLCVIEAISSFYKSHYATVHRAIYGLSTQATAMYDAVRDKVQTFIGARYREEILFTKGTTDGINLVASCFSRAFLNESDEVLISETEHHSNIIPWQMVCEMKKAKLVIIPCNHNGEIDLIALESLLTPKVKLIAIAHVANTTGTIHPIEKIISMAHRRGVKVLVDGAQSISHMNVNVTDLDADFYVFSGHKAYGPTGIGVVYSKLELLEAMPPYQGGGDMVEHVSFEKTTYQSSPLKFEAGTPPIAEVMGLGAAIDFIEEIGRDKIATWEMQLLDYAQEKLKAIDGVTIIGNSKNKGPIISFIVQGVHPLDLGTMLSFRGVAIRTGHMCAQPTLKKFGLTSMNRVSFGLYNTKQEVDDFISALVSVLSTLRG